MDAESKAPRDRRRLLLAALGVILVALLVTQFWSDGAGITPSLPSAPPRDNPKTVDQKAPIDPRELNVRLEALESPRPDQGETDRNPFRFRPKPPPPQPRNTEPPPPPVNPVISTPPPPPPPRIPLKLIGFVELPGGGKLAALSDCKGSTFNGAEGKTVDGQYRIVKIGIESVTIEFVNGKARQDLRLEGCPPR